MKLEKRIVVWLAEVLAEALLFGCWFGVLLSGETGLLYGIGGSILAVPVLLFLNWYYVTRALAGLTWISRSLRLYPATATCLFVIHVHVLFSQSKHDLTPFAQKTEVPFLAGGACIVFTCAFAGNWGFSKGTDRAGARPRIVAGVVDVM
jgi:hypothetical protein